jgi:hypothetical protein
MDDGVSIFHPKAQPPPNAGDWSWLNPAHEQWFRDVFLHDKRLPMPPAGAVRTVAVVPVVVMIPSLGAVGLKELWKGTEVWQGLQVLDGVVYALAPTSVFREGTRWKSFATAGERQLLTVAKLEDPTLLEVDRIKGRLRVPDAKLDLDHTRYTVRDGILYTAGWNTLIQWNFWRHASGQLHYSQRTVA